MPSTLLFEYQLSNGPVIYTGVYLRPGSTLYVWTGTHGMIQRLVEVWDVPPNTRLRTYEMFSIHPLDSCDHELYFKPPQCSPALVPLAAHSQGPFGHEYIECALADATHTIKLLHIYQSGLAARNTRGHYMIGPLSPLQPYIKEIKMPAPTPELVTYFLRRSAPTYPAVALTAPVDADFTFGIQVDRRGAPSFAFLPSTEWASPLALPRRGIDLPTISVLDGTSILTGYYIAHFQAEVYLVQAMVEEAVAAGKLELTAALERSFGRYTKSAALGVGGTTIHERSTAIATTKALGMRLLQASEREGI